MPQEMQDKQKAKAIKQALEFFFHTIILENVGFLIIYNIVFSQKHT